MSTIHPTAIVSSKATIGKNITVAPFAIISEDVVIGDDCYIGPHTVIYDGARIGNRVRIYQSASIAHTPQDLKFGNEKTFFEIGDDTRIHEFVTLHRGTKETGFSRIGKNCLIMAYTHVAHDVTVGDNCIIANVAQMAGHVTIGDFVVIGGLTAIHQFCRIGSYSMIGAGFKVTKDVPPYVLAGNEPLKYSGLNVVGLRRRGFSNDEINSIKTAYTYLYNSGMNVTQAIEKIKKEYHEEPRVKSILEFITSSKRGIIGK